MLELRPNVRKYWVTAGDMTQLFQSGEVVMGEGWPLMTNQLRQANYPAGETIPTEGTTAWADHWMLTKGAKPRGARRQLPYVPGLDRPLLVSVRIQYFSRGLASASFAGRENIQVGVRWSIVTCFAFSAIAGTMVTAVAPEPITTTFLSA